MTTQGQKLRLLRQQENSLPLNQLGSFSGILDGIILLFTPLLIKTKGSISKALIFIICISTYSDSKHKRIVCSFIIHVHI